MLLRSAIIKEVNLSGLNIMKDIYAKVREKNNEYYMSGKFNNYSSLYRDIYVSNDRIYLVCPGPKNESGDYILVLKYLEGNLVTERWLYPLKDGNRTILMSIAVTSDGRMLVYDSISGALLLYDLNRQAS
ncbi:hypothetical protein GQ464_008075 [Rhodocaloribacter litoris]|uniref:hypothetical protein n=1 Tax=Rhodocaloribacter litoris TaxID=2558931 RepID=UPI00141F7DD5|nr:hypothetical protein [Rhodocaloribacter litoris]QXD16884.1 hypothetical protein GQ464_008075 [Rhodocaloribacter litoris]